MKCTRLKQRAESLTQNNSRLEQKLERLKRDRATFDEREGHIFHLIIKDGKVWRGLKEVRLAKKEFQLLKLLQDNVGTVTETQKIIEHVWAEYYDNPDISVDQNPPTETDLNSLIHRLRAKINIQHDYIKSHRGRGFEFEQWQGVT
jgi:DNA-binding response OmpR family regulator